MVSVFIMKEEPPRAVPSGGSRPLGPLGRKPVMAHSTICLFCRSTDLDVSVSSVLGHALKAFPARGAATWGGQPGRGFLKSQPSTSIPSKRVELHRVIAVALPVTNYSRR